MNQIKEWMEAQPPATQRAIVVTAGILHVWYKCEENAVIAERIVRQSGFDDVEVRAGIADWLRMSEQSDDTQPVVIQKFFRDPSGLTVDVLRRFVNLRFVDDLRNLESLPPTIETVNRVAEACRWQRLRRTDEMTAFIRKVDAYSMELRFRVIDEKVEDHARKLLADGTFPGIQDICRLFLQRVVDFAPESRTLPERAAATFAFLTAIAAE